MKISKITITEEERNQAIEQWFKTRCGLVVQVQSIDRNYGGGGGFVVDVEVPEPIEPPKSAITTPEELGQAIVEGKV